MAITAAQIARVRAFNRDYTRRIGVLSEGLLDSPYSLTEGRVLYEIAHRQGVTAGELADELALDRGYLSRLLKGFESRKLLAREVSSEDGRRQHLRLTPAGKRAFAPLERRSRKQVSAMLAGLDDERRKAVLAAMEVIQSELGGDGAAADAQGRVLGDADVAGGGRSAGDVVVTGLPGAAAGAVVPGDDGNVVSHVPGRGRSAAGAQETSLRFHRPGDMGWVVQRHGELYCQEYGWDEEFEALVAQVIVDFIRHFDAARERCWIAERGGRRLGSIFLVAKDATTAKLRLLLVEPEARGLGIGRMLVTECVRFARAAGYESIVLWTQENLTAARRLYAEAGFEQVSQESHRSFGKDLVAETWELELRATGA